MDWILAETLGRSVEEAEVVDMTLPLFSESTKRRRRLKWFAWKAADGRSAIEDTRQEMMDLDKYNRIFRQDDRQYEKLRSGAAFSVCSA